MPRRINGFTLIELMIVVAIIGILAAIAVPQYTQFLKKSKFTEIVNIASSRKSDVATCIQNNNSSPASCHGGTSGNGWDVKPDVATPIGNVNNVTVTAGIIRGEAITGNGLNGEDYILTPTATTDGILWTVSGSCTTTPRIC